MQPESDSCNDEMRVASCTHLVEDRSVGNQFFVNRGWKEIPRKGGQSNLKLLQFNNVYDLQGGGWYLSTDTSISNNSQIDTYSHFIS